jgi:hypothetical protein
MIRCGSAGEPTQAGWRRAGMAEGWANKPAQPITLSVRRGPLYTHAWLSTPSLSIFRLDWPA